MIEQRHFNPNITNVKVQHPPHKQGLLFTLCVEVGAGLHARTLSDNRIISAKDKEALDEYVQLDGRRRWVP